MLMCESMSKCNRLKNAIPNQMYLPGDFAGGVSTLYLVRSLNIFSKVFHSEFFRVFRKILHYAHHRKLADEKPSS